MGERSKLRSLRFRGFRGSRESFVSLRYSSFPKRGREAAFWKREMEKKTKKPPSPREVDPA